MKKFKLLITTIIISSFAFFSACNKKDLNPYRPIDAEGKRRQNIEEGRGASIGGIIRGVRGNNFEFSSSNPMWRASLETLDFLPLTTVDYSGGMIITDWYSDNNFNESIKITVRFLSNEIGTENLKIIIHKKTCNKNDNCRTKLLENSKIRDELISTIIKKAAKIELDSKKKK